MYINPSIASIKRYHLSDDSPAHNTPQELRSSSYLDPVGKFQILYIFSPLAGFSSANQFPRVSKTPFLLVLESRKSFFDETRSFQENKISSGKKQETMSRLSRELFDETRGRFFIEQAPQKLLSF